MNRQWTASPHLSISSKVTQIGEFILNSVQLWIMYAVNSNNVWCTSLHNWPFHSHKTRALSLPPPSLHPLFPIVLHILFPRACIMILLYIDTNFIWLSMMIFFLCHGYTFDLTNKRNFTCANSFLKLKGRIFVHPPFHTPKQKWLKCKVKSLKKP